MSISSKRWILFFFCCSSILTSFNIAALTAVIPAISRSLNVSANDAASIIPYYLIPYGLSALLYTPLMTYFSIRRLMICSTILYVLGNWMCVWVDNLSVIIAGRVVAGFGASAVMPLGLMILGKIFEPQVRGRVLGLFFSASFLGAMLGLMASALFQWHWLFIVPAFGGIVVAVGFFFCPAEGLQADPDLKVNYIEAFQIAGLRRLLIFIFFMSMLFNGVCKWYGVYLDEMYRYPQATISGLIILTALASAIGQNVGGFITDKLGRLKACYIGIVILAFSVMALYGHYPLIGIALVLFMISIGWTIAHNGISTVLTDFPDRYRAELAGLNSSVRFVSGGMGFWLSGAFVQMHFGMTFLIIGILMLALVLLVHKIIPQTTQGV